MVSKYAIPHLEKAESPHILMLSPPLEMKEKWFAPHLAYSIAKFGMSLCVLGLACELRPKGIAVNALWPRHAVATMAVKVFSPDSYEACRRPEIMADAAYAIVTRRSRDCTGRFYLDDEVLREEGMTDEQIDAYWMHPEKRSRTSSFLDYEARAIRVGVVP